MVDIILQHVIPSVRAAAALTRHATAARTGSDSDGIGNGYYAGKVTGADEEDERVQRLQAGARRIQEELELMQLHSPDIDTTATNTAAATAAATAISTAELRHLVCVAHKARELRLKTMVEVRGEVDEAERSVPAHLWTLATYKQLLFMDQHTADVGGGGSGSGGGRGGAAGGGKSSFSSCDA